MNAVEENEREGGTIHGEGKKIEHTELYLVRKDVFLVEKS